MSTPVTSDLLGQTLIMAVNADDEKIILTTGNGETYTYYHDQDCCEHVRVQDIEGRLEDLVGAPLLLAEETSNSEDLNDYESQTWTFYRFGTSKGYVTIRWLGESNGYYSEYVSLQVNCPNGVHPHSLGETLLNGNDQLVRRLLRVLRTSPYDPAQLLIFADALEEAGCDDDTLLRWCRLGEAEKVLYSITDEKNQRISLHH